MSKDGYRVSPLSREWLEAPTLLVWGDHGRLVPGVYADEFARRLPRTRLEVVKGAGHAPHLEQPDAAARLVHAFLSYQPG